MPLQNSHLLNSYMNNQVIQTPADDTITLDKDKRKCILSDDMIKLLLRQLQKELYNMNLYFSFSNYYGVRGYQVLEEYYRLRAEEEKHHHDWCMKYLNNSDAEYKYPEIPAINERWNDMVTPFQITVDAEILTTEYINEIVDLAIDEGDWQTYQFLMSENDDTGRLVQEQFEEMSISRTALDIAKSEGSWLRKEKSIMNAYKGE